MSDFDRPAGQSEGEPRGTYEVFGEVEHFQRHCEDWAEKLSRCWKLVDTGNPKQMVANSLREWADELDPSAASPVSVEGEGDVPDGLNLYLCRDCESWSSLACHDERHHQRSFRSVRFVPVAADEGQLGGVEGEDA